VPAQLLLGLILGQAVPAATADAAEMDRIRKALAQPPAIDVTRVADRADKPVFRLTVHGRRFDSSPWENWTLVPSYIRPSYPLYHNEMLMMWTPEAFRSSVLYPGAMTTPFGGAGLAVPVTPIIKAVVKQTKAELRRRREAKARREVHEALAAVLTCRADPSRPGC
jgi:hypothetical protein